MPVFMPAPCALSKAPAPDNLKSKMTAVASQSAFAIHPWVKLLVVASNDSNIWLHDVFDADPAARCASTAVAISVVASICIAVSVRWMRRDRSWLALSGSGRCQIGRRRRVCGRAMMHWSRRRRWLLWRRLRRLLRRGSWLLRLLLLPKLVQCSLNVFPSSPLLRFTLCQCTCRK